MKTQQEEIEELQRELHLANQQVEELKHLVWTNGTPPKYIASEWFIATLDNGDKVVLTALPEEYSYDFKTADDTYYAAHRIKKWMQFPTSQFKSFGQDQITKLEAACAGLRQRVMNIKDNVCGYGDNMPSLHRVEEMCNDTLNSSTCGQGMLEENERMRKALEEIMNGSGQRGCESCGSAYYCAKQALSTHQTTKEK